MCINVDQMRNSKNTISNPYKKTKRHIRNELPWYTNIRSSLDKTRLSVKMRSKSSLRLVGHMAFNVKIGFKAAIHCKF